MPPTSCPRSPLARVGDPGQECKHKRKRKIAAAALECGTQRQKNVVAERCHAFGHEEAERVEAVLVRIAWAPGWKSWGEQCVVEERRSCGQRQKAGQDRVTEQPRDGNAPGSGGNDETGYQHRTAQQHALPQLFG